MLSFIDNVARKLVRLAGFAKALIEGNLAMARHAVQPRGSFRLLFQAETPTSEHVVRERPSRLARPSPSRISRRQSGRGRVGRVAPRLGEHRGHVEPSATRRRTCPVARSKSVSASFCYRP